MWRIQVSVININFFRHILDIFCFFCLKYGFFFSFSFQGHSPKPAYINYFSTETLLSSFCVKILSHIFLYSQTEKNTKHFTFWKIITFSQPFASWPMWTGKYCLMFCWKKHVGNTLRISSNRKTCTYFLLKKIVSLHLKLYVRWKTICLRTKLALNLWLTYMVNIHG